MSYVPAEGDKALIDKAVAKVVRYDAEDNVITFVIRAGNGINRVQNHISSVTIEELGSDEHSVEEAALLDEVMGDYKPGADTTHNPQPEPVDSPRVRGEAGDKPITLDDSE